MAQLGIEENDQKASEIEDEQLVYSNKLEKQGIIEREREKPEQKEEDKTQR